jgi:D-tyrosyl-tRNA(Tyr) deacylase
MSLEIIEAEDRGDGFVIRFGETVYAANADGTQRTTELQNAYVFADYAEPAAVAKRLEYSVHHGHRGAMQGEDPNKVAHIVPVMRATELPG